MDGESPALPRLNVRRLIGQSLWVWELLDEDDAVLEREWPYPSRDQAERAGLARRTGLSERAPASTTPARPPGSNPRHHVLVIDRSERQVLRMLQSVFADGPIEVVLDRRTQERRRKVTTAAKERRQSHRRRSEIAAAGRRWRLVCLDEERVGRRTLPRIA